VVVGTLVFGLFFLLLFPAGVLWQRTTMAFLADPPPLMEALSTFQAMLWATAAYGFVFWGGMLHATKGAFGNVVAVLVTSVLFCIYHYAMFAVTPPTSDFLVKTLVGGLILATFTLWAGSVLPTLIVHQLGQFFHFAALQENPFAEDLDRLIPSLIMLVILFGIYEGVVRLLKRRGSAADGSAGSGR
jgi:membrane protease YdiL (CAAX protease family)